MNDEQYELKTENFTSIDEKDLPACLLDKDHPYYDRLFSKDGSNRFIRCEDWLYIFSYTDNIDNYYFEFFKMRPDGSEFDEFYYYSFQDDRDIIHITNIQDGWVYFTIDTGSSYKDCMVSTDGGDEIILERGKYDKGERTSYA